MSQKLTDSKTKQNQKPKRTIENSNDDSPSPSKMKRIEKMKKLCNFDDLKKSNADDLRTYYYKVENQEMKSPVQRNSYKPTFVLNLALTGVDAVDFEIAIWDQMANDFWMQVPKDEYGNVKYPFVVSIQKVVVKPIQNTPGKKPHVPKTIIKDFNVQLGLNSVIKLHPEITVESDQIKKSAIKKEPVKFFKDLFSKKDKNEIIISKNIIIHVCTETMNNNGHFIYDVSDSINKVRLITMNKLEFCSYYELKNYKAHFGVVADKKSLIITTTEPPQLIADQEEFDDNFNIHSLIYY